MLVRRSIFWLFAMAVACAPVARAQLEDEILFPIEYAILPEPLPVDGLAFAFPRTIEDADVLIELRNFLDRKLEGPLTFTVSIESGPWVFGPWTAPPGFQCFGTNRQQTCVSPYIPLPPGEKVSVVAPLLCPTFSNELARIRIFGPELPPWEFTIKQHNSPFVVVAGYTDLIMEGSRATFTEKVSLKNIFPAITGRADTLFSISEGTDTLIDPPVGDLWGGSANCAPGTLQICPTGPLTFGQGQTFSAEYKVGTTVGTKPLTGLFSFSLPDNPTYAPFNVTHPVQAPLAGPDLMPKADSRLRGEPRAGSLFPLSLSVWNRGQAKTEGTTSVQIRSSAGLKAGSSVLSYPGPIFPLSMFDITLGNGLYVELVDPGPQWIELTVTGGGDVDLGNNKQRIDFQVLPSESEPIDRVSERIGRILSGR